MLDDYFSIQIAEELISNETKEGQLVLKGLPLLLSEYQPNYAYLPLFLYRLASKVDFSNEQRCLDGIARELARLYSRMPSPTQESECEEWKGVIQYVLYPNMKKLMVLSDELWANGVIETIASTDRLYRVFERC